MKKGTKLVCVNFEAARSMGLIDGKVYSYLEDGAIPGTIHLEQTKDILIVFPINLFKIVEPKTPEEIDKLKNSWRKDPCWDIWATEGFELHQEELRQYAEECEKEWDLQAKKREEAIISNLKLEPSFVESNPNVIRLLLDMKATIDKLQQDMMAIGYRLK